MARAVQVRARTRKRKKGGLFGLAPELVAIAAPIVLGAAGAITGGLAAAPLAAGIAAGGAGAAAGGLAGGAAAGAGAALGAAGAAGSTIAGVTAGGLAGGGLGRALSGFRSGFKSGQEVAGIAGTTAALGQFINPAKGQEIKESIPIQSAANRRIQNDPVAQLAQINEALNALEVQPSQTKLLFQSFLQKGKDQFQRRV